METVYSKAIDLIKNGSKFNVNFENKSLTINKKTIVKNGVWDGDLGLPLDTKEVFIENVERLYERYKYSLPSEYSETKRKKYFLALKEKDLSDDDMLYGEPRALSQALLEIYILFQILSGFQWSEDMGNWFWQSKKDKDLILLKKWF